MQGIRLPLPKDSIFTGKEARLIKPHKKVWSLRNVFQVFGDVYSERVENLLQRIEQCQRVAGWARLWTIEYQDFRQSESYFTLYPCPYQAVSDNIGAMVPASCGLLIRGLRGYRAGR
jgi:hypothetical protein